MLEFKRGIVIYAYYERDLGLLIQSLVIRETDGNEYPVKWYIHENQDFFGEGDKVSFLIDEENNISVIRLNPFYKEG